ncbi:MAG: OmpH family outer membrane protein [Bacteroidales bacterium]|nr:OmpH family outer membrane protein [Bacteroidales bacterium]
MKTLKTLCLIAALAVASAVNAQDLKFAHVDSEKLIADLPEKLAAEKELQDEAKKLEDQMTVMNNELQQKYQEYINGRETMPDLIRQTKEKEIRDAQDRLTSYQQMAQQSLAQKEQQLLTPIIEKVQKAIDEVGKENGFIYIFDINPQVAQVILYHSDKSTDASSLVRAKLGLK